MIKASDLPDGTHFWAIMDGALVVIGKFGGNYSVCGPWECYIRDDDFEIIEIIKVPTGQELAKLYYL